MQTILHSTSAPFALQGVFTTVREAARAAQRWIEAQAQDERDLHLAGAADHEDFVRRQRDCAAFERHNALIPRCH